jgi:hypothetical protein
MVAGPRRSMGGCDRIVTALAQRLAGAPLWWHTARAPTTKPRIQVTIDDELANALATVDAAPASRSRLIRDLAIRGGDAIRADRLQAREALSHLTAIADGDQPHDFTAVSSVLAGRGDRLP